MSATDWVDATLEMGLGSCAGALEVMPRMHRHGDLEISFTLSGGSRAFNGAREIEIPSGRLLMMWAGKPHQVVEVTAPGEFINVIVPLNRFARWPLPAPFRARLLSGELLQAEAREAIHDVAAIARWHDDIASGAAPRVEVALLEIEARIRRMALGQTAPADLVVPDGSDHALEMALFIARNFAREIGVNDVAASVGLNPRYATGLFKGVWNIGLNEFLTLQRVQEAQRLLATRDDSVLEIASMAGFNSSSQFYQVFRAATGLAPNDFRARARERTEATEIARHD